MRWCRQRRPNNSPSDPVLIASYTAIRPGAQGLFNRAVKLGLRIPYSHNELVFSDGMSGSCSFIDQGIRLKRIEFQDDKWHFRKVDPRFSEDAAREFFERQALLPTSERIKYSIPLLFTFVFPYLPINASDDREVCCTCIGRALGIEDHRRYDPYELPLHVAAQSPSHFV
ncbi:MAG: hypothetical protein RL268_1668 [Pseudomonadota bacterium]|jgi:hypothetical protein